MHSRILFSPFVATHAHTMEVERTAEIGKILGMNPDNLSIILRTHMIEGDDRLQ